MKHVENFEVGTIEENISYLLIFIKCALKPSLRILASFLVMSKCVQEICYIWGKRFVQT